MKKRGGLTAPKFFYNSFIMDFKNTVIRDPVHGDIFLSKEEIKILDTWEMQRLRGIHQLGTAYLVFPGATHTRFEHSIGTMYMASEIFNAIRIHSEKTGIPKEWIGNEAERIVRIASLLHDITHIPFGHNIEDQSGLLERHDSPKRIRKTLTSGEIGEILKSKYLLEPVLDVLGAGENKVPPFWQDILSDTISADILDYLQRDAYYTGLNLKYDKRVLSLFRVDKDTGKLYVTVEKRGMLREDAVSEIIRVLEARYYFSERVYYHHAKVAAGALITRAVEEAFEAKELKEEDLFDQTDFSLINLLSNSTNEKTRNFAFLFSKRVLPKRVCIFPRYLNKERQEKVIENFFYPGKRKIRREWEEKAEKELGTGESLILYCPRKTMQLKETSMLVKMPKQELKTLSSLASRFPRVKDLENSYMDLWKLYLFCISNNPMSLDKARQIGEKLLPDLKNAYNQ